MRIIHPTIALLLVSLAVASVPPLVFAGGDAPTDTASTATAADIEGTWLPFGKRKDAEAAVLRYFASRVPSATAESLVAMGMRPDRAAFLDVVREELSSDPRELAETRERFSPAKVHSIEFDAGVVRYRGPEKSIVARYTLDGRRGIDQVVRVAYADGRNHSWRIRSLGADGLEVRTSGDVHWYVRAPEEVVVQRAASEVAAR